MLVHGTPLKLGLGAGIFMFLGLHVSQSSLLFHLWVDHVHKIQKLIEKINLLAI